MAIFLLKNLGFDYQNHIPNSHDFARTDYHLFPIPKKSYKGKMFGFIWRCKQRRNRISMTKDHICFGRCEKKIEKRYVKCIKLRGEYLEYHRHCIGHLLLGRIEKFSALYVKYIYSYILHCDNM